MLYTLQRKACSQLTMIAEKMMAGIVHRSADHDPVIKQRTVTVTERVK